MSFENWLKRAQVDILGFIKIEFNANSAIFQLYHGENKLIFNGMKMRSALY